MRLLILLPLLLCGCESYLSSQIDLTEQARAGLVLCRQAQDQRAELVGQLFDAQRQRLDAAFDDDVRARPALDADWIIEHRKAYAAGLDLLLTQRRAADQADAVQRDNLRAIDAALARLRRLQQAQLELLRIRSSE